MTRFATTYLTLARLYEMKTSLMTMFNSEEWKTSKFGTSQEGRKVQNVVLDSRFWKNVSICLKVVAPLMVVLRLVDSDVKQQWDLYMRGWIAPKRRLKATLIISRKGNISRFLPF